MYTSFCLVELGGLLYRVGGVISMTLGSKNTLLLQKQKKNNNVSMQRIKKRVWKLEWIEKERKEINNHLKCCGSTGGVMVMMVKKKNRIMECYASESKENESGRES